MRRAVPVPRAPNPVRVFQCADLDLRRLPQTQAFVVVVVRLLHLVVHEGDVGVDRVVQTEERAARQLRLEVHRVQHATDIGGQP